MIYLIDGEEVPGGVFWEELSSAYMSEYGRFFRNGQLTRIYEDMQKGCVYKFGNSPDFGIYID